MNGSRMPPRSRKLKYDGSSCGISTLNELQDELFPGEAITKSAETQASGGKAWANARATNHRNGRLSTGAGAGASAAIINKEVKALNAEAKASAEFGLGGALAEASADASVLAVESSDGIAKMDVLKGNVGGGVGIGAGGIKAKVEAGVDLVGTSLKLGKRQEVSANLGLNADTGIEAGLDGVGVKFLGLGASIGRTTGFQTPIGGFYFKLW